MEINSSFIPKKDIKKVKGSRKSPVNVFLLISIIIFLTAVLGSAVVWLWKDSLRKENQSRLESLNNSRDNFGLDSIEKYVLLSNRIAAADQILSNHTSVEQLFEILEDDTLTSIVLSNFDMQFSDEKVTVTSRGIAPDYNHVALQADQYTANTDIKELLLSNVNEDNNGGVSFNLSFSLDKKILLKTN